MMMERIVRTTFAAGFMLILVTITMIILEMGGDTVITIIVSLACGLLFFSIFRWQLLRKGEVYRDERTQKIHNSSLAFSWWIAYLMLAVVTILSFANVVDIPTESFTTIMFFIMIGSYWLFKKYLSVKGEVA
jgi:hypothetical protein